ncbi:hypothetical protein BC937DRAFT_93444 [Endogone sp. FLAS-F59071]|nr:hypothetical protein BC937DRAFT_93444 [Endogone sp. FLAS-F59071]|eukprot:RUS23024.1 hypothetical protein BC937DRAFT_93444 [Endogone sp. FLAS-F59071]
MQWQDWECFIAEFVALCIKLLIELGYQTAMVGEIYPGAFDKGDILKMYIKLYALGVCRIRKQFPSCPNPTNITTGKSVDWKSYLIINGMSAQFTDSFTYMDDIQDML